MRFSRDELLAGVILALVLMGTPVLVLTYQLSRVSDYYLVKADQERGFSPAVIYVQPGERVILQIHAEDVVHGFQSRALGVSATKLYPGKPEIVEFTAPAQPGEYGFACTALCGRGHGEMLGKVIVLPR